MGRCGKAGALTSIVTAVTGKVTQKGGRDLRRATALNELTGGTFNQAMVAVNEGKGKETMTC